MRLPLAAWQELLRVATASTGRRHCSGAAIASSSLGCGQERIDDQLDRRRLLASIAFAISYNSWLSRHASIHIQHDGRLWREQTSHQARAVASPSTSRSRLYPPLERACSGSQRTSSKGPAFCAPGRFISTSSAQRDEARGKEDGGVKEDKQEVISQSSEPPKRKRGRPRKVLESDAGAGTAAKGAQEEDASADSEKPSKPSRRKASTVDAEKSSAREKEETKAPAGAVTEVSPSPATHLSKDTKMKRNEQRNRKAKLPAQQAHTEVASSVDQREDHVSPESTASPTAREEKKAPRARKAKESVAPTVYDIKAKRNSSQNESSLGLEASTSVETKSTYAGKKGKIKPAADGKPEEAQTPSDRLAVQQADKPRKTRGKGLRRASAGDSEETNGDVPTPEGAPRTQSEADRSEETDIEQVKKPNEIMSLPQLPQKEPMPASLVAKKDEDDGSDKPTALADVTPTAEKSLVRKAKRTESARKPLPSESGADQTNAAVQTDSALKPTVPSESPKKSKPAGKKRRQAKSTRIQSMPDAAAKSDVPEKDAKSSTVKSRGPSRLPTKSKAKSGRKDRSEKKLAPVKDTKDGSAEPEKAEKGVKSSIKQAKAKPRKRKAISSSPSSDSMQRKSRPVGKVVADGKTKSKASKEATSDDRSRTSQKSLEGDQEAQDNLGQSVSTPDEKGRGAIASFAHKVARRRRRAKACIKEWQLKMGNEEAEKGNSQNPFHHLQYAYRLSTLVHDLRVPFAQQSRDDIASLRKEASDGLTKMLDSYQRKKTATASRHQNILETSLRIQAEALDGNLNAARSSFERFRASYSAEFKDAPSSAAQWLKESAKGKRSPYHLIARAMTSIILGVRHQLSAHPSAENVDEAASDTLLWMLDMPEVFAFITFANVELERNFNRLMSAHSDIVGVLGGYFQTRHCSPARMQGGTESILLMLCAADDLLMTSSVFYWSRRNKIPLREPIKKRLVRWLEFAGDHTTAELIAKEMLSDADETGRALESSTCRALISFFAKMKDMDAFDRTMSRLKKWHPTKWRKSDDFIFDSNVLLAGVSGDPERSMRILSKRYDFNASRSGPAAAGLQHPDFKAFQSLFRAYLSAGRVEDAQRLLSQQIDAGFEPSVTQLNHLLESYVERNDVSSALSLFETLEDTKVANNITYTNMLKLFSQTKDVTSATNLIATMQSRGIDVDRKTLGLLLNTHIEAGGWQSAMQVFEYMENSKTPSVRLGPSEYNTMLKAHVQRALPVQETYAFLRKVLSKGIQPSPVTYSLILQAACDAGIMDLAEDVFTVIEDRLGGKAGMPVAKGANSWHFSIMIKAYFRINKPDQARDYLDELHARGLPVLRALKNIIVDAAAGEDAADDFEEAREVARSYVVEAPADVLSIYLPLLQAASKRNQSGIVRALITEIVERDIHIPIHTWTILLDALRREDNVEAALELWRQIFDQAIKTPTYGSRHATSIKSGIQQVPASQRNVLCIPLSIIIDVLTRNKRTEDVARIWITCRRHGFGFDSHNWNHMAVALLRARRMEDGCGIIEFVLNSQPPASAWKLHRMSAQDMKAWRSARVPEYKLDELLRRGLPEYKGETENLMGIDTEGRAQTPQNPPNRRYIHRTRDNLTTRVPPALMRQDGDAVAAVQDTAEDDEETAAMSGWDGDEAKIGRRANEKDKLATSNRVSKESSTESQILQPGKQRSTLLQHMAARDFFDRLMSPWFAHFETMQSLTEILDDARRRDGYVYLPAPDSSPSSSAVAGDDAERQAPPRITRISVNDLMRKFPRTQALLSAFEEKVESIHEQARLQSERN